MTDTTAQNDGSIESALDNIIELPEEETEEIEGEYTEETEDDSEIEASNEDDESGEDEQEQEDEDDTENDESSEAQLFTVTVDGKEEQVTLEDLKRGYSGQKYVQQGMERAANTQKQAEHTFQALQSERQMLANLAQQFMQGQLVPPPFPPPMEMMQSDPIGYFEQKEIYEHNVIAFNQQMQNMMAAMQPGQGDQQARQAYLQQQAERLREYVPELQDQKSADRIKAQVATAAEHYGYSQEEIAQVMDHRALRILIDAAKYREVVGNKSKADEKAAGAVRKGKPLKAGSKRVGDGKAAQFQRQKSQLKKSGRVEDALGLILG